MSWLTTPCPSEAISWRIASSSVAGWGVGVRAGAACAGVVGRGPKPDVG